MDELRIVDTTLRDGDISLWAYGRTTGKMLPVRWTPLVDKSAAVSLKDCLDTEWAAICRATVREN